MTFPTTGLLDNFNRADENPLANGNWSDTPVYAAGGACKVVSNQAAATNSYSNSYWSAAAFGPDCEAYLTVPTFDLDVVVLARLIGSASSMSGYDFHAAKGGGAAQNYRLDSGAETLLDTASSITWSDGDSCGLEIVGNTIKGYQKVGAGSWTNVVTSTDSTYTGAGYIGQLLFNTNVRADNFSGGTIGGGGGGLLLLRRRRLLLG